MLTDTVFPDLMIEELPSGLIELSQDGFGGNETASVVIHRLHVKALAEQLGLVPKGDPRAAPVIAMLMRRLRALQQRIRYLQHFLVTLSDHEHADLSRECDLASTLADLADEFVMDLEAMLGDAGSTASSTAGSTTAASCPSDVPGLSPGTALAASGAGNAAGNAPTVSGALPACAPKSGCLEGTQKRGSSDAGPPAPRSNAQRQRDFRERQRNAARNGRNACDVTCDADQLELTQ